MRVEFPGAVYHVTARGNERKPIFRDDDARRLTPLVTKLHVVTNSSAVYCPAFPL